jgi:hypothetical protein
VNRQAVTFEAAARVNIAAGELTPAGGDQYTITPVGSQPLSPNLTALAGLVGAADRVPYFTALATMALATLTAFGRSLVAAATPTAGVYRVLAVRS